MVCFQWYIGPSDPYTKKKKKKPDYELELTFLSWIEGGWERFWGWWSYWFWWGGELVSEATKTCDLFNLDEADSLQATIFMCALVAFSFYWIRRQQYELFLIVHIVLSILVLITMLVYELIPV
jgi:hypothetical protein